MGIVGIKSYFSDLKPLTIDLSEIDTNLASHAKSQNISILSSRWHASGTKVAKSGTSSLQNILEVFLTCFSSLKTPSLAPNTTNLYYIVIFLIF